MTELKTLEPFDYQWQIIDWLCEHPSSMLNVGMGLGKTASTLEASRLLLWSEEIRGVLIVAPMRVATITWPSEIEEWENFKDLSYVVLRDEDTMWEALMLGGYDIYITNYEQLPKLCKVFHELRIEKPPFDVVAWDESTKAKNHQSKRINKFRSVIRKYLDRHWALTGTMTPNCVSEVFAQMRLIDNGERLGKFVTAFTQAHFYFPNPYNPYQKELKPGAKESILKKISDITLTLRTEDHLDIAPMVVQDVEVPLPREARKSYNTLEKDLILMLEDESAIVANNAAILVGKLQQITAGAVYDAERNVKVLHEAKLKALEKLVDDMLEPVVIMSSYVHERQMILDRFPEAETFGKDTVERWNDRDIPILVANHASMSHGLNLQKGGRDVIWNTVCPSNEAYGQTNGRFWRRGQERQVRVTRLICPKTVDEVAVATVERRGADQEQLVRSLLMYKKHRL